MLEKIKSGFKKFQRVDIKAERIPELEGRLLVDKVALVTGGSSGIGFGIAKAIVSNGGKVIISGRDEHKLIKSCHKLGDACAHYIVWDASSINFMNEKVNESIKKFGKIDILVNNAGYHGNQNFMTVNEDEYDTTFNTNLKFVFFLSQALAKYYIKNKIKGNILNIASASSMKPAWSPYEISKWGVRGFTRGLARELAPYGIVVNGIAPGPCATNMSHWSEGDNLNWLAIPSNRLSMPEEIGNLAVVLVSSMGKNILGETVFCDGGSGLLTSAK